MKILTIAIAIVFTLHHAQSQSQSDQASRIDHLKSETTVHNYENITQIQEILELFSVSAVGSQWTNIYKKLSTVCGRNMMEYLDGLEQKEIWAIKMDDASGRYSPGYLWGNNYWMGSMAMCNKIYRVGGSSFHTKKQSANTGLTSINGNDASFQLDHSNPPFFPRFGVLKVVLNGSFITPAPRVIHIGVCLPSSCDKDDIYIIADSASHKINAQSFQIKNVRIPNSDGFSLWTDSTFIAILIVSITVGSLIAWGTLYEFMLKKQMKVKMAKKYTKDLSTDSSELNVCTTYDLTRAVDDKKNSCAIGIGIQGGLNNNNNNNSDENLAMDRVSVEGDKMSLREEILLSFSLTSNFNAICDRNVGSDTISCIHGIRALSMAWIILGHTCIISFKYSDNMEVRKYVEEKFFFQTITNGAFSVDTFFFISGFLVSFIYFRTNAKGKLEKLSKGVNEFTAGAFHFFGLVAYRFARLTVPYLYVLGIVEVAMKYFASTSVFEPPTNDHINCPKYWWRNVLYINTLFPVQDMCMLWSWYLANDTQFYIIGAIILIVAIRHFKFAAATLGIFMISAWLTTGIIAYTNNHMPNTDDPLALFDKIYDKPWTRLGPYLVGMSVGWILFKTNCKIKFTRVQLITGWTLSIGVLLYLLYGLYKVELTKVAAAAYSSLSHSAWAMALAWIVIACSTGNGGFLNRFLSATCLYPFSRVTYCAYLVHPIIIRAYALNTDAPLHMSIDSMVIIFFGQTCASYLMSFVVSLAFEAPVCALLRILAKQK